MFINKAIKKTHSRPSRRLPLFEKGKNKPQKNSTVQRINVKVLTILLLVLVSLLNITIQAAEKIDREYLLKTAYLFNILKFISWPDTDVQTLEQLQVCIIGPDLSNGVLFGLQNKRIDNIIIAVKQKQKITEIDHCRVLYFTQWQSATRIDHLAAQGFLLIGENDDFIAQGGTLNFYVENNKLRFEINLSVAAQAGIKFSSKLLRLARIIDDQQD